MQDSDPIDFDDRERWILNYYRSSNSMPLWQTFWSDGMIILVSLLAALACILKDDLGYGYVAYALILVRYGYQLVEGQRYHVIFRSIFAKYDAKLAELTGDPPPADPAADAKTPDRLSPRFGVRTLFLVVTLICVVFGWLAWQASIVRERNDLWTTINDRGGSTLGGGYDVSTVRYILGDKSRSVIGVPRERFSPEEIQRIEQAFPEAAVVVQPQENIGRYGDEDES